MENNQRNKTFAAACYGMMFFGITMVALGSILPSLATRLDLTDINKATLASTLSGGILIGSLIFGPVCDRYGHRALFLGSCISVLLGMAGIALSPSFEMLIISYILIGVGGGVLNGQTNTIASDLYDDEKTRGARLSLLGAFYGVGAIAITVLVGLLGNNVDYKYTLLSLAAVLTLGTLLCFTVKFPAPKQAQSIPLSEVSKVLGSPVLIILAFVLLCESSVESVTNNFATSYFSHINNVVLLLTVMMVALTIARFVLSWLSKHLSQSTILYIFFTLLFVGFALMPTAKSIATATIAMILVGFGTAATYPVVLGQLGSHFKSLSGTAFGIAISIALAGSSLINYLVGSSFKDIYPYVMMTAVILMAVLYYVGTSIIKAKAKK